MRRNEHILRVLLVLAIILSACGTVYFMPNIILRENIIVLVLVIILVASLSLLIALFVNAKQSKTTSILRNRLSMWNSISYRVKRAGESAFNRLEIGIIITNDKWKILWTNDKAREILDDRLVNRELVNVCKELYTGLMENTGDFKVNIRENIYRVNHFDDEHVIYLTNIDDFSNLETNYENRIKAIGYINIDNIEAALSGFDDQERDEYRIKINGIISKWAEQFHAFFKPLGDNRYLLLADREDLELMVDDNFSILDNIKNIMHGNRGLRITISMGISCTDKVGNDFLKLNKASERASAALDKALNRGGDQVVLEMDGRERFFGAKDDAIAKDVKVEVRFKSEELQDLMESSNVIYSLAHKAMDADGFGAALCIYKMAKALGKEAYIIIDDDPKSQGIDQTVRKIYDSIQTEYKILASDIVTPIEAIKHRKENDLLMIVDFQISYQLVNKDLVTAFKKYGIIDHHRKGDGALENHRYYYCVPYASSCVEILIQLCEFWKEEVQFSPNEATWLLLGILIDTNNFIYHSNPQTFEIASQLKRFGANMTLIQRLLSDSKEEVIRKNEFMENIEFHHDGVVAFSFQQDDTKIQERAFLAKIADELITISGVELGISIGYLSKNQVGVSARSLGKINAQIIMEKLGPAFEAKDGKPHGSGGGHFNNAAAQISDFSLSEVKNEVVRLINETIKEENAKIIFIKDVKGKGKMYEIKSFDKKTAYELYENNCALYATPENIEMVNNKRRSDEIKQEQELEKMNNLKVLIDTNPIRIYAKTFEDGRLKKIISLNQIIEAFERQYGYKIDSHSIEYSNEITTLGSYKLRITLTKDIITMLTINVIEN